MKVAGVSGRRAAVAAGVKLILRSQPQSGSVLDGDSYDRHLRLKIWLESDSSGELDRPLSGQRRQALSVMDLMTDGVGVAAPDGP